MISHNMNTYDMMSVGVRLQAGHVCGMGYSAALCVFVRVRVRVCVVVLTQRVE